jgi:hypothetical protein
MIRQIDVEEWLFPDGGLWYIYSKDRQQPCVISLNPDDPAEKEEGIVCFVSKEVAEQYLEIMHWEGGLDLARFTIRFVEAEELLAWLARTKRWAQHLIWRFHDDSDQTFVHVSIPIEEVLKDRSVS